MLHKYAALRDANGRVRFPGPEIAYTLCPQCGGKGLALLEQGYTFAVYLCDYCGAKIEQQL